MAPVETKDTGNFKGQQFGEKEVADKVVEQYDEGKLFKYIFGIIQLMMVMMITLIRIIIYYIYTYIFI